MRAALATALVAPVALVALLAPASASAYAVGGHAWPGDTIGYHTAARAYSPAVDRAARAWNRARAGVRFVKTARRDADVVVRYGQERCAGRSPMGYGRRWELTIVRLGADCSRSLITLTAIHELGHVLGLDHDNRRCARMNDSFSPGGTPGSCAPHSLSYWLKNPLEPDDIAGARAIYRFDNPSRDRR